MKPSSRGSGQKQAFSLLRLKFWRDCTEDDECSCVGTQRLWFRVWRGKSCPNSLVFSWSMTLYVTCLWLWRKLDGTNIRNTSRFSRNDFACEADVDFLVCWCCISQSFHSSWKKLQKERTIILVWVSMSWVTQAAICSTLSVKTSHRTSHYLCIATVLESLVQCHVHIGEIFAFYGLPHILCYIMSGYCATTQLGFQYASTERIYEVKLWNERKQWAVASKNKADFNSELFLCIAGTHSRPRVGGTELYLEKHTHHGILTLFNTYFY